MICLWRKEKTWVAGTSPAMTMRRGGRRVSPPDNHGSLFPACIFRKPALDCTPAVRHGNQRLVAYGRQVFLASQRPSMAPVGSVMMLKVPAPMTSVASFITFAPSDLALAVA